MANVCQWCDRDYEGMPARCPHCDKPIMRTLTHMRRVGAAPVVPLGSVPPPDPEPDPEATAVDFPRSPELRRGVEPARPGPNSVPASNPPPAMPSPTPRPAMRSPTIRSTPEPTSTPTSSPAPASTPPKPAGSGLGPGAFQTQKFGGIDVSNLNIAKQNYTIEVLDNQQRWVPLFSMIGTGRKIFGREAGSGLESLRTLASKHVMFDNNSRGLIVRAGPSLNGVFRRLRKPVPLTDGMTFRIANYILTFREVEPPNQAPGLAVDGEHLLVRDLWALGYLDFLRPDRNYGVRYPILNPVATILGRGGTNPHDPEGRVDLPLFDDPKVSRRHAQITGRGRDEIRLTLSDLDSGTGTWLKLTEPTLADDGDEFWLGEIVLRIVASR